MNAAKQFITLLLCGAAIVSVMVAPSHAINFATAIKRSDGLLVNLYPYWFSADVRTGKNGAAVTGNLGLDKYGTGIGASYYSGDWLFNTVASTGNLEINSLHAENGGIGDTQVRVGRFLAVNPVTVMPALAVKVPTGSFSGNRPVNLGDGQADLAAELYLYKLVEPFSVDALIKYTVRFHNPHTGITPGNEFATEWLATWRFADNFRIGPALNVTVGADRKSGGSRIADSGIMKLSAGGEMYYQGFSKLKLSFAGYKDVVTRNTTEGFTLMNRITIPF